MRRSSSVTSSIMSVWVDIGGKLRQRNQFFCFADFRCGKYQNTIHITQYTRPIHATISGICAVATQHRGRRTGKLRRKRKNNRQEDSSHVMLADLFKRHNRIHHVRAPCWANHNALGARAHTQSKLYIIIFLCAMFAAHWATGTWIAPPNGIPIRFVSLLLYEIQSDTT